MSLRLMVVFLSVTVIAIIAERSKRFIIFDGSGVTKFVAGVSYPIQLTDKQRSLSYFYNFQAQYTPPPRPLYWWSYFNTSTFAARNTEVTTLAWDTTRIWCYKIIENMLESAGFNGRSCLERIICEVSQLPFHVTDKDSTSIYARLLNLLLIPRHPNVPAVYLLAHQTGHVGGDCLKIYSSCNYKIWHWFLKISKII